MKKILTFCLVTLVAIGCTKAQNSKPATAAIMTTDFIESVKKETSTMITADYSIKLWYMSDLSAEGKLISPKIWRQVNENDINYNDLVVNLRKLLQQSPAWKSALDATGNPIQANVEFGIIINKNEVTVTDKKWAGMIP